MTKKFGLAIGSILAFGVALVIAGVGGCNVHELGHLVSGTALDIPIDHITWCAPANGRVAFSYQEPAFVGYSGGFLAATVLATIWWFVIRPRLASPFWWAAGVAILGTAISQIIVGLWEGSSPLGYDQAQGNLSGLLLILIGPLIVAALIQFGSHRHAGPDEA